MKVLVSAITCNPEWGSEAAVGWKVAMLLSQKHEVFVLTHNVNKKNIEKFERSLPDNLKFIYHGKIGEGHPNRLLARLFSWSDYIKWNRGLLEVATEAHKLHSFDLCHHVTYVSWRVPTPLADLGIPTIWGPLGGGENFPWRLCGQLSYGSLFYECLREFSNFCARRSAKLIKSAREVDAVLAANEETAKLLKTLSKRKDIRILSGSFFSQETIEKFSMQTLKTRTSDLRIFAGGNLEGRKGIALALRGLKVAKDNGLSFCFTIGGNGSERAHLENLARRLEISQWVQFTDGFSGQGYVDQLKNSDVYLVPSLRDNAPLTLMEAMLSKAVPIVLRCGGPKEIVNAECGFAIEPRSTKYVAQKISEHLLQLFFDRKLVDKIGTAAQRKIRSDFSAEKYLAICEDCYQFVVRKVPG